MTSEKNSRAMNLLKELPEDVLEDLSLKDLPFSILQPATEDDINSLEQAIGELNETFPNMDSMNDAKKSTVVLDFF